MNTRDPREPAAIPGVTAAVFRGKDHIRKNMPCQDAYAAGISGDGWIVMAVADGVSRSPHSEEAARAATRGAVDFWKAFNTYFAGDAEILSALRASMNYALAETDRLRNDCREAYSHETTLTIVVVDPRRKKMYYSFAGDGGVYLLSRDGTVQLVTDVMRDGEGSVYTLSEGPGQWRSGERDLSDVSSILMVTDGISDVIRAQGDDFSAARWFMAEESSDEAYARRCKDVLSKDIFLDMNDDAAIVRYAVESAQRMPWDDGPEGDREADNPIPKENPADLFFSAFQRVRSEIRSVVDDVLSKKTKGRRNR